MKVFKIEFFLMILKRIFVWVISLWFYDFLKLCLFLYNGIIFDGVYILENCLLVIDVLNYFVWGILIEGIIFFSICWKILLGFGGLDGLIILNWFFMFLSVEDLVIMRNFDFSFWYFCIVFIYYNIFINIVY